MTGAPAQIPRFGDPDAPRWLSRRLERLSLPICIALATVVTALFAGGFWRAALDGELTRLTGYSIGAFVVIAMGGAGVAVWSRLWAPLRRAVSRATLTNSSNLIVGGRLPALSSDVIALAWPNSIRPNERSQNIVLTASTHGLSLNGIGQILVVRAELSWLDITDIAVVEYVEAGRAYDGIAIVGPTPDRAIVVQMVRPTRWGASFPRGEHLTALRNRLLACRPATLRGSS